NESFRTHGVQDGQGLDLDHVSNNSVMQYNYSHDNEGGFMLIMNWYEQTSPTVRYNISQNDKDKIFELARGGAQGTAIYNNTIFSDSKLTGRAGVIDMPSTSGGTGV
ncbi:TPA: cell surface protein, partial [Streptococcus suis]